MPLEFERETRGRYMVEREDTAGWIPSKDCMDVSMDPITTAQTKTGNYSRAVAHSPILLRSLVSRIRLQA
jgi:hypothetical protein